MTSIEYYLAEAGSDRPRDRAAYYLDNGAALGEDRGRWWLSSPDEHFLGLVHGAEVAPHALRDLAQGRDPITGYTLGQMTRANRMVGYDLQFAAPKSVSVLWAAAGKDTRRAIEELHDRAVSRALTFIRCEHFVEARRGKNGVMRENDIDYVVAQFRHTTSRAGDPQLHTHAVLLNVAHRADGTYGTLDNKKILHYQGAIGAAYRAEFASLLSTAQTLAIVRRDRAFEIDGVPEAVTSAFSKRRDAIEEVALANGFTTAHDRQRAQIAALETRTHKAKAEKIEQLHDRWTQELAGQGWTGDRLWQAARAARARTDANRTSSASTRVGSHFTPSAALQSPSAPIELVVQGAVRELELHDVVIEKRHLLRAVIERAQGVCDLDTAESAISSFLDAGGLVQIAHDEDQEPVYATPEMVNIERQMIADAVDRKTEREFVAPDAIEGAIARRPGLSEQQIAALRRALNSDGVSIVEGRAGSGKSFALGAVADAARKVGMTVWTVAPSWKATGVIKQETETATEMARALQGFLGRLDARHPDPIALGPTSLVILDEAGMVGTRQMAQLLAAARVAGAKVVLSGDTRQLQPVTAGAPLAALARAIGTQTIEAIRRQRSDWQRDASQALAKGQGSRALEAYDARGGVIWAESRADALRALADDWAADLTDDPNVTRLVMAGWHREVKDLNDLLRARYREAGRLGTNEVPVTAISRGRNGKPQSLALAEGDRVIFGETVSVAGVTINNADTASVAFVCHQTDGNPHVRFAFDDGRSVAGAWLDFTGRRDPRAKPDAKVPRLQHAYAVTIHAAQGTTVDKSYLFAGHAIGAESAYVGLTRHRDGTRLYVDTGRVIEKLHACRRDMGATIGPQGFEGADADDPAPLVDAAVTIEHLRATVAAEFERSEAKRNICDFIGDALSRDNSTLAQAAPHLARQARAQHVSTSPLPLKEKALASQPQSPPSDQLIHGRAPEDHPADARKHGRPHGPVGPARRGVTAGASTRLTRATSQAPRLDRATNRDPHTRDHRSAPYSLARARQTLLTKQIDYLLRNGWAARTATSLATERDARGGPATAAPQHAGGSGPPPRALAEEAEAIAKAELLKKHTESIARAQARLNASSWIGRPFARRALRNAETQYQAALRRVERHLATPAGRAHVASIASTRVTQAPRAAQMDTPTNSASVESGFPSFNR